MVRRTSPLRLAALAWLAGAACARLPGRSADAGAALDAADAPAAPRIVQLSAAGTHACAVDAEHAVWCWGSNLRGESAPDRAESAITRPRRVDGVAADSVAAGWGRTCALGVDGGVQCWGLGDAAPEGPRALAGAAAVAGLDDARQVVVGAELACALRASGAVACWAVDAAPAEPFPSLPSAAALGALRDATCALRRDGRVSCFGRNDRGQRGAPVAAGDRGVNEVDGLVGAVALAAGGAHACALDGSGALWCWGANGNGQLMLGHVADSPRAARSDFALGVAAVAAGADTTFARGRDGRWLAAGLNDAAQLQFDDVAEQVLPRPTLGALGAEVTAVAAATGFGCALLRDGGVRCWGGNVYGSLGNGALGGGSAAPVAPAW